MRSLHQGLLLPLFGSLLCTLCSPSPAVHAAVRQQADEVQRAALGVGLNVLPAVQLEQLACGARREATLVNSLEVLAGALRWVYRTGLNAVPAVQLEQLACTQLD